MLKLRHIAGIAAVVAAALVLTLGINRIVVTDGQIKATVASAQLDGVTVAFKSDYLPLER